ncbi:MAG: anthranilate phosphoribosyltransferase [Firmicutes bacterium]|nr:anthranilate phosphoribosyltransferase [Bacillota bacterium]
MLKYAIQKLIDKRNLEETEIMDAMDHIMEGRATQAQIGSFLTALRLKGETIEEITGCARVMRDKAYRINPRVSFSIDTCGTGGDGSNTFNISTASAFVAAAAGIPVAKHGNRSVSSKSGSADVLEALGIDITISANEVEESIEKVGIGFMFAPMFHKSMKHAAGPRKELGFRTIFNILGPLTNPANVKGQVVGVFSKELTRPIAEVLLKLGIERAMVIHGLDGLDEISLGHETLVSEVKEGIIRNYVINPEMFGLKRIDKTEVTGGSSEDNAKIIMSLFRGEKGPKRDVVLINSAAALCVGGAVNTLAEGIELAAWLIDSGMALRKLEELRDFTCSKKAESKKEVMA